VACLERDKLLVFYDLYIKVKPDHLCNLIFQLLPEYQIAEQRAVFKTTQIYGDTMKEVQKMNADKHSLGELRGMSKPHNLVKADKS
jgi:hypothetical protein